ncbi:MAG: hypothetical protein A2942_02895 [Candidatus Lloydbacteria bacterium RIFCSPLOWO2_01_FULL_50_20]|uniref:ComEC/Rec2-related protein domain-containing protein n=1 Tax=Candidatus Lloydbacteria bacterium RIFCSPLOWO2_01_FULL_50_20 TaxID=1798665 RepID=A0A1G2DLU4_9BACT|nr:MAG: hypothetical protein A2942_02895 [Candidatus Lloydbacteria bacterium RIFCSPLOWO2_01_FULL_50_20]
MPFMQFLVHALVPILIAFLVGVGFAAYISVSLLIAGSLLFISAVLLVLTALQRKQNPMLIFGICALAIFFGVLRFIFWSEVPRDPLLRSAAGQEVMLRGIVSDEPDVREKSTLLTFSINELIDGDDVLRAEGKVLLIVARYPQYQYGDAVEITGVLKEPEAFAEENGRTFDYPNYLKAKGMTYQFFYPRITVLGHGKGNLIRAKLFATKHAFLERLSRVLAEPENALAGGILLGGKRSLGTEWTDRFRETGIVHIVVLSGYNMTIIAEWLGVAFLFLGFYGSLAISAIGIVGFALMTGAGATVVRAAIMALLVLLARLTGRTSTMGRALLVAGTIMVLHNPSILAFDPSFQLSFLAALGLVTVAPVLRERITIFRAHPLIEEVVISTLATQIMVLPLLLYQTGLFSTVALFANLLVLPIIPVTMLFAFATGLAAFLGNAVAFIPALPTEILLAWILGIGKFGASLPFAAIHVPPISGWFTGLLYALLAWIIYRPSLRELRVYLFRAPS